VYLLFCRIQYSLPEKRMIIPLRIVFLHTAPSDAVEAEIRKRARKLDEFCNHVMHCKVTVDAFAKHQQQGRPYAVRIDITVPGTEIVINRRHRHEDVYVAIRDAFEAAYRKLQDYVQHQFRRDVKHHAEPVYGRVKKLFEDGYGFIETEDGREYYFDRSNMVHPDFDHIDIDTEVQFLESAAGEGLQAKHVLAGKHNQP